MSFRVRVYLRRPDKREALYIGEKDLKQRPVRNGHVIFEQGGKSETARVEMIVPDNWEQMGAIPTITVAQGDE